MAILFEAWCEHYEYDPESEQARDDWERYREEKALFESIESDDQDDQLEPQQ